MRQLLAMFLVCAASVVAAQEKSPISIANDVIIGNSVIVGNKDVTISADQLHEGVKLIIMKPKTRCRLVVLSDTYEKVEVGCREEVFK